MPYIAQVGETPRLRAVVTDCSGNFADPATIKITIEKLDRTSVITAADMTKDVTGKYYYDHTAGPAGEYRYNVVAVGTAGRVTIVKDRLIVNAAT